MPRSAALLTAALLAAGLAACGDVDSAELESQVKAAITKEVGTAPKSIECPEECLKGEVGAKQTCELTAPNGDRLDVFVTVTEVDGNDIRFTSQVGTEIRR